LGAFGDYLVEHDYVSSAEVEEASHASALYGGRLGTAMLELGLLTPEDLDRALARFHGLPEIPREWLVGATSSARAVLDLDRIRRHGAFPLDLEKRTLHVGMLDPRNDGLRDEIAFASGFRITAYALSEFRFCSLLFRIYRVTPSARMRLLLDDARRVEVQRNREQARRSSVAQRSEPAARIIELTDEATFHAMLGHAGPGGLGAAMRAGEALPPPAPIATETTAALPTSPEPVRFEIDDTPGPVAAAPRATAGIPALERTLHETLDRTALIDAALRLAGGLVDLVALFVVRDEMAVGHTVVHAGALSGIESIVLPLSSQSLLGAAARRRAPASGLASDALDKLLARALRGSDKVELTIYPISIGERLVSLLVVQSGLGALPLTSAAALSALTGLLGTGFERVIRHQKRKPAPGDPPPAADAPPASASPPQPPAPARRAALGQLQLKRVRVPRKEGSG
jgi:hypothetical protein